MKPNMTEIVIARY